MILITELQNERKKSFKNEIKSKTSAHIPVNRNTITHSTIMSTHTNPWSSYISTQIYTNSHISL